MAPDAADPDDSDLLPSERRDGGADAAPAPTDDALWCQVSRILDQHCSACHTAGGVGPMPLETHADLTADSKAYEGTKIYERVGVRIHDEKSPMPASGRLPDDKLAVIDQWIADGAPDARCTGAKSGADAGTSASWPAHCDAVYRILSHAPGDMDAPYVIPKGGEIHPKVPVDAPWGDEEIQAIAFRPVTDNAKVLHHWILNAKDNTFLVGWAPGSTGGGAMRDDVGMYMPRGAGSMFLDMHYFNLEGAGDERDRSGVEICALKKPNFRPNVASVFRGFGSLGGAGLVLAPASTVNNVEEGSCRVWASEPVHLLTAAPHAHTYAVHMKFTVVKPDGREIVMHDAPFSFHNQESIPLQQDVILTTGDVVRTACTYTNTTTKDIRFGESTTNEMCFNFAVYYPMGALSCTPLAF